MKKEFDIWNTKKENIDAVEQRPFFHEKEIWFCRMGVNVGFEIDGKGEDFLRPVLIVRKFGKSTFLAVPLSKSKKEDRPYFYTFSFVKDTQSTAVLSQVRLIDAKRLSHKVGEIEGQEFRNLIEKLKELFP